METRWEGSTIICRRTTVAKIEDEEIHDHNKGFTEHMATIYLSCTTLDLREHKLAVKAALDSARIQNINTLPHMTAADKGPQEFCLQDVAECDIYVGFFGFRYGSVPISPENPEGLSITELEYRHARKLGKQCLIFLGDPTNWPFHLVDQGEDFARISALRSEFEDPGTRHTPVYFPYDPMVDLSSKVTTALLRLQRVEGDSAGPAWPPGESPYPGFAPFGIEHHPVYFGREAQVREALEKLEDPTCGFLLVSGSSGSGKSSLIKAGLLPRLTDCAKREFLYMRPGEDGGDSDPFAVLADELRRRLPNQPRKAELAQNLREQSGALTECLTRAHPRPRWLLLDQMEELFTICLDGSAFLFLDALFEAAHEKKVVILASIRNDYLPRCQDHPLLLDLLQARHYVDLWKLGRPAILDMIREPARLVGLDINEVAEKLADETEDNPGNLPLLAAALRRLWEAKEGQRVTIDAYDRFGGIRGVVGTIANEAFNKLSEELGPKPAERAFHHLFAHLVRIDVEGQPTRNVVPITEFRHDNDTLRLIELFGRQETRLLVYDQGEGADIGTVQVNHEALFDAWPKLKSWIGERRDDEWALALAQRAAAEWAKEGYHPARFDLTRALDARQSLAALERVSSQLDVITQDFLFPTPRLISMLDRPLNEVGHKARVRIGELLDRLGEDARPGIGVDGDGLPIFDARYWITVPGGEVNLENETTVFKVEQFRMARLPVTQAQFKAFVNARDGYKNSEWWAGLEKECLGPHPFLQTGDNRPVTQCTWTEALAYCRWVTSRLAGSGRLPAGQMIRLPSETEWQQAATGGDPEHIWPWGAEWREGPACTVESNSEGICAVGLFPMGSTSDGILDMVGNVWEWTGKNNSLPQSTTLASGNKGGRVLRGGSWHNDKELSRAAFRLTEIIQPRNADVGFRMCLAPPIAAK